MGNITHGIHMKGIRRICAGMFGNCKQANIFIRKPLTPIGNPDRLVIEADAFSYATFDPLRETQAKGITLQRPAIYFEYEAPELLKTTTSPTTTIGGKPVANIPVEGETGKYYTQNELGQREFITNIEEMKIEVASTHYMREVYFGATGFHIEESVSESSVNGGNPYAVVSYATLSNGFNVLMNLDKMLVSTGQIFNKNNHLNLCSERLGSIPQSMFRSDSLIHFVVPEYDCLDPLLPKLEIEKVAYPVFCESNNNNIFNIDEITDKIEMFRQIFIYSNSGVVGDNMFKNFTKTSKFLINSLITELGNNVFENCIQVSAIDFYRTSDSRILTTSDRITTQSIFKQPVSLVKLGDGVFKGCVSLDGLFGLPDSIEEIGIETFSGDIILD